MKRKKTGTKFLIQFIVTFVLLSVMAIYVVYNVLHLMVSDVLPLTALLVAVASLLMCVMNYQSNKNREYKNIEHGSAHWGKHKDIAPYRDPVSQNNILLSSTEALSMDMYKTHRDCHVFVVGGSGSGKSRFYALPNILQMNASYVITDPSGEHLRNDAQMLKDHGYKVKVFNTVDMQNSLHFNPFRYYKEPEDIIRFTELFIANTSGGHTQGGSEDMGFWKNCEKLWFMAHIAYIQETCLDEEKNMNSLVLLLTNSETKEEDEEFKSPVDILFDELGKQNPDSFAVKQYKKYKLAAGVICSRRLIYHKVCSG